MLSMIFTNAVDTTSSAASSDFTILKEIRWKWTRCSWNIRSTSARCSSFKTPNRSIIIIGSSWVIRCSLSLSGRKTHLHKCFSHGTIFQIIPQNNPTEKRGKRAKPMTPPPFFAGFPGDALTASRASVATLAIFASWRAAKTLVGEPPQTQLWDILSQSNLSASPFAIAPVPFCAGRP